MILYNNIKGTRHWEITTKAGPPNSLFLPTSLTNNHRKATGATGPTPVERVEAGIRKQKQALGARTKGYPLAASLVEVIK